MKDKYDAYLDYGLTSAQYHKGLDKLWKALRLNTTQTEDVFTLVARKIEEQREQIETLRELREYDRSDIERYQHGPTER